jgi:hypothetical protein
MRTRRIFMRTRRIGGLRQSAAGQHLWGLPYPEGNGRRGNDRRHRAEHEHEADPAEPVRAECADRRTEQEPGHLGGSIQPEGLATAVGRRGVRDVAPGRRVVDRRREPGERAQDEEPRRARQHERQAQRHRGDQQPHHHERHAPHAVREPTEDRLADEPGRRPCRDHEPEQRQVDAVVLEPDREHREECAEPEPDDQLRAEEREDATPAVKPGDWIGRGDRHGGHAEEALEIGRDASHASRGRRPEPRSERRMIRR